MGCVTPLAMASVDGNVIFAASFNVGRPSGLNYSNIESASSSSMGHELSDIPSPTESRREAVSGPLPSSLGKKARKQHVPHSEWP